MTKVEVNPGICGLNAIITADSEDGVEAKVTCETKCAAVTKMFEALGEEVDAYKAVFCKVERGRFMRRLNSAPMPPACSGRAA
jgi:hypothetical protein